MTIKICTNMRSLKCAYSLSIGSVDTSLPALIASSVEVASFSTFGDHHLLFTCLSACLPACVPACLAPRAWSPGLGRKRMCKSPGHFENDYNNMKIQNETTSFSSDESDTIFPNLRGFPESGGCSWPLGCSSSGTTGTGGRARCGSRGGKDGADGRRQVAKHN